MTNDHILKRVLQAKGQRSARKIIRNNASESLAQLVFDQILIELGRKPQKAKFLAEVLSTLIEVESLAKWGYRAKAVAQRLEGRWLASANSFVNAGVKALPHEESVFAGGAIDSLARAGRMKQAVQLGDSLYSRAKNLNQQGAGKTALNTGHAHAWFDQLDEAESWYAKATQHFRTSDSNIELGMALIGQSTAGLGRKKSAEIVEITQQAISLFEQSNSNYYLATAKMNLADAERLRGNLDVALSILLSLSNTLDPEDEEAFRIQHEMGGIYLALNMWAEAEDSYLTALQKAFAKSMIVHSAGCWQGIAEARLALGKREAAKDAIKKAKKLYKLYGDPVWVADVRRLELELEGKFTQRTIAELRSGADVLKEHKQWGLLIEHLLLLAKHDSHFELNEVARIIRHFGLHSYEWRLHYLKATRTQGAAQLSHYQRMVECIWRERAKLQSHLSLVNYLQNKSEAIQEFLEVLLQKNSRKSVEQAIGVIIQTRSTALIDEILSSQRSLSKDVIDQLDELREAFVKEAPNYDSRTNRQQISISNVTQLQRNWRELTTSFGRVTLEQNSRVEIQSTAIYAEVNQSLFLIHDGRSRKLEITKNELLNRLRWIHFDLSEPGMGGSSSSEEVSNLIAALKADLHWSTDYKIIAPDGIFWGVPWQSFDPSQTTLLSLTPGRSFSTPLKQQGKKTVIWYQETNQLPHVLEEVELLQNIYPNATICGTLAEARESLREGHIDVLHVATHGYYRPSNPMFSSIEFPDGEIFAAEISRSDSTIDLAVLAACHSGAMSANTRFEPDGLSRAFLALGAKNVFAGQWAIDDEIAPLWASIFHKAYAQGVDVVNCSNKARIAIANERPHPYFWSSVIGFSGYQGVKN